MEPEGGWWRSQLAADIHQSLRMKELKLPTYKAHSPQMGMRRYFADLLAVLSNRYRLCPAARHLAVYLLDLFMDHYDVAVRQLYVIALSCLLLASKFEEKEDRVPKLEQLNSLGFMCSLNLSLNRKDLVSMELLLLETFGWNLCMPTPAHFIDFYLHAAVQDGDLHNGWPLSSLSKTRAFVEKYTHYFLEVSLQDHSFLSFRPSQVAAACIAASRVCLQIGPSWTTVLHLLTGYSWEHLSPAHDNDVQQAKRSKSNSPSVQRQPQALPPPSSVSPSTLKPPSSTSRQLLFQPGGYQQHLSQHSAALSQLHMLGESQALGPVGSQDYLQAHPSGLLSGSVPQGAFPSFPGLTPGLHSPLPLQGPLSMQVALTAEPRHCLSYGTSYLGSRLTFATSCFNR
ncbi:cyclin-J-like protein isoform X2 [Esox lucius]|uniref:cyclin-J-like protein isoform X2 n=1 Tax=Esox lucius TaxID=8010 RepID=UPI0005766498|nr:cyclin-J-like protein isoform X2 [Esox lucius]